MTVQSNNNNLNYLIDPTFIKVNRLFILSFKRLEENNAKKDHRDSFSHYYVPNVEIKDFNVLINEKSFFDFPLWSVNLSKQTELKDPQQINFIGKLEGQNNGATMFFIIEKSEETTFEFSQNFVNIL